MVIGSLFTSLGPKAQTTASMGLCQSRVDIYLSVLLYPFFFFFRCFPVFYRSSKAYLEPSQTSIDLFIIDAQLNFHCPPLKDWLINRFKSSQRKITHPLLFFFYWKEKLREMKRYNELFCEKYVCLTAVRKTILSQYEANYQNLWKRELIWILSSPISKTNIWVEIIWWWRVFDPIFGFYLYLCFL